MKRFSTVLLVQYLSTLKGTSDRKMCQYFDIIIFKPRRFESRCDTSTLGPFSGETCPVIKYGIAIGKHMPKLLGFW